MRATPRLFRLSRRALRTLAAAAFCTTSALSLPLSANGQAPATARVVGRVFDQQSGKPISGAIVRLETNANALTDDRGWFVIEGVPLGDHRIAVEMLGYERREEPLRVTTSQVSEIRLTIAQRPIDLEPIEVSVHSGWLEASGFYEREQNGSHGEFIDRQDIEKRQPQVLTDLLRDVPGIRIYFLEAGRKHVRINRGGTNNLPAFDPRQDAVRPGCEPDLYLDGQAYRERIPRDGTENKVDGFDIIQPEMIEGIEVYTGSSAPLQYQSSCGVILVWTRRGQPRLAGSATSGPAVAPRGPAGPFVPSARTEAPDVSEGSRVRLTRRLGGSVTGTLDTASTDSIGIFRDGTPQAYAILDLRKLERDEGIASFGQRTLRGAKWGFMLSAAAIVFAAASQEFSEAQNGGRGEITDNSPRKPIFGLKVISGGSVAGAFLGGLLWRYHRWVEVPIR